jgi:phosphoribosylaminoimidazolecarboxamide formyltransferase / IMP cyclohydrolase
MAAQQNALISVYDKKGIETFAQGLVELDWNILSSGGTARYLDEAGVPVTNVSELVGGEAILGHRVVTLSREVHAGLMADPSEEEDMAELDNLGIPFIDLVCVDMYPLQAEVQNPIASPTAIREMTDIGGPTMLRAGAKGRRIVVAYPKQREPVLEWLREGQPDSEDRRLELAASAELVVADYVMASAAHLARIATASETRRWL